MHTLGLILLLSVAFSQFLKELLLSCLINLLVAVVTLHVADKSMAKKQLTRQHEVFSFLSRWAESTSTPEAEGTDAPYPQDLPDQHVPISYCLPPSYPPAQGLAPPIMAQASRQSPSPAGLLRA